MQDMEGREEENLPIMEDDDLYGDLYTESSPDLKNATEGLRQGSSSQREGDLPLSTPLLGNGPSRV